MDKSVANWKEVGKPLVRPGTTPTGNEIYGFNKQGNAAFMHPCILSNSLDLGANKNSGHQGNLTIS
jgi:hypothetical protein